MRRTRKTSLEKPAAAAVAMREPRGPTVAAAEKRARSAVNQLPGAGKLGDARLTKR